MESLRIVSIKPAKDYITVDSTGSLPERYGVLLGLSRRLSTYERALLLDDPSLPFIGGDDLMWLGIAEVTLDEIESKLPALQTLLAEAERDADALKQAAEVAGEALAAAQQAEVQRRRETLNRINSALAIERQPKPRPT